jgi:hypothetical protein
MKFQCSSGGEGTTTLTLAGRPHYVVLSDTRDAHGGKRWQCASETSDHCARVHSRTFTRHVVFFLCSVDAIGSRGHASRRWDMDYRGCAEPVDVAAPAQAVITNG